MANVTRHIGLSLGADICWPIAFEEVLARLETRLPADERPAVRDRLFDQAVRRQAGLPVLSLFSLEAQTTK